MKIETGRNKEHIYIHIYVCILYIYAVTPHILPAKISSRNGVGFPYIVVTRLVSFTKAYPYYYYHDAKKSVIAQDTEKSIGVNLWCIAVKIRFTLSITRT